MAADLLYVRRAAAALVACGAVSVLSEAALWARDVAEAGATVAAAAIAANLGVIVAGWLLWTRGEIARRAVSYYALGLVALGLLATYGVHASAPAAFLVVTGVSLAVLLYGEPGKTRVMVGFVLVALVTSLVAVGAVRQLGHGGGP